jgi:hypothetical protein
MMKMVRVLARSLSAAALLACSSSGGGGTLTDGGSGPDGARPPDALVAADGAGADANNPCNTLSVGGAAAIPLNQVASEAPAAMGGTFSDGTYLLTRYTTYTGPGGATGPLPLSLRIRWDLAGGTVQSVEADGDGTNVRHFTARLTTSGTRFTETQSCPRATVDEGTYSATATSVTEWVSDKGQVVEAVFTKQ